MQIFLVLGALLLISMLQIQILLNFFIDICNTVEKIGSLFVIIGGDFNQVRNLEVDKTNTTNVRAATWKLQLAIDVL